MVSGWSSLFITQPSAICRQKSDRSALHCAAGYRFQFDRRGADNPHIEGSDKPDQGFYWQAHLADKGYLSKT
jgi:hypothetical protein